ncbi:MAG: ferrous iron transport protein B [Methanobrevibacter sp.]|jgi:ferrous iron transport protein B|nr:ferrous iron transport protein B [Candidatus Methanovirga aequatorialis]
MTNYSKQLQHHEPSSGHEHIKIGLAGNPNVGKTTLFNHLTGLHQHVGNWPGKTVEKAEGHLKHGKYTIDIVDLPGNYALSAHSIEEIVSRDFIVDESSDVIVNVLDANNLERNLYLTTQMMELGANLVIAINMNKFAKKRGYRIDMEKLSILLGIPVVEIEARDDVGREELLKAVENAKKNPIDGSKKLVYGTEIQDHLLKLQNIVEEDESLLDTPPSWTAIKLLENDEVVKEKVEKSIIKDKVLKEVEKLNKHFHDVFNESSEEVIANNRYAFIDGLLNEVVTRPEVEAPTITEKIDKIVINRILGLPIFLIIMWLIFQVTFAIGTPLQEPFEYIFSIGGDLVPKILGENIYSSFIVDGLINGVGGVLVFIPLIFLMFLMISVLEDSGYLARAAFVMDRVMHKFVGLHGKSFIPMILGFGCGVPGVMATRTMEHERDRILTMLLIPFMSCTARLPIYTLFVGAFFTAYQGEVIFSLYFLGVIVAIIVATILKRVLFKGITTPFVMELPTYKLPSLKGVLIHTWEKTYGFIRKAGTIILATSIIIWLLSSFPAGVEYGSHESVIGQIGNVATPIFAPLGFGYWQPTVALIFGIVAKEVIVSTFSSLFGVVEDGSGIGLALQGIFTPLTAFAFLVFVLLYVPCFSFLATVKKESNSWKWPLILLSVTIITAYTTSFIVYHLGLLIGFH